MATVTATAANRLNNILMMVKKMTASQQIELETLLARMLLLEKAKKLDKSVKKNSLTMKEIVEELRKVRDEN